MRRWTIDPNARNWQQSPDFAAAVSLLRDGQLVAVPTETVYGLAADATNARACAAIYEVKGRPQFNPLISHVESLEAAERHGQFEPKARQLAESHMGETAGLKDQVVGAADAVLGFDPAALAS